MSSSSPIISLLNHTPGVAATSSSANVSEKETTRVNEKILNKEEDKQQIIDKSANSSTSTLNAAAISSSSSPVTSTTAKEEPHESKVPPRKRSKVSRACDECRRKKIKCDASLQSASSNTQCSNCFKTNEFCTFTRVPLKRGPTKGYIRDFEGKVDIENRRHSSTANALTSGNLSKKDTTASSSSSSSFSHHLPPLPISHQEQLQQSQQQAQLPTLQTIVLPPIDQSRSRAGSNLTLSPRSSVPALPLERQLSNPAQRPQPQQQQQQQQQQAAAAQQAQASTHAVPAGQGHFWKVPYEYSSFNNERRGSADSLSSSISDSFSPFLNNHKKPRVDSNSIVSDSDDEIYQRKSSLRSPVTAQPSIQSSQHAIQAQGSGSMIQVQHQPSLTKKTRSPDSVSSLSSLNNKLNFGLNFENQHLKSPIDLKNVEASVLSYYENYHQNTSILPLNSTKFINSIVQLGLSTEVEIFIVDLFNSSLLLLNNSNKNSTAFTDDIRLVFQQIVKTYPIFNKDISSNEFLKLLFLSTLIILNYCIVLSGQDYSIGLNVTVGIFNDFQINKLPAQLQSNDNLDYDDLIVIYSRLYFQLVSFDMIHSVGYNKNSSIAFDNQFALDRMIGGTTDDLKVYKFQQKFVNVVSHNDHFIDQLRKLTADFSEDGSDVISSTWREFVTLCDAIQKMKSNFSSSVTAGGDEEEEEEFIFDNFLKITRHVKKLINQLTTIFDNFYSANLIKTITPFATLIFTNFFKILLSLKNLIISIIKFQKKIGNHDLMSRLKKLETEINSIFYKIFKNLNFENLNILNNLNFINQRFNKNNQIYDVSITNNSLSSKTDLATKVDEWLKYLDLNFVSLVKDVEYGWLL